MFFSSARICSCARAAISFEFARVHADAGGLHAGQHGGEREIDLFADACEPLFFDFRAEHGCEAHQKIGAFAGSAGKRPVQMAEDDLGEGVIRGGGPEKIRVEHGGVAHSGEGSRGIGRGQQSHELGVMHDFGPRGIGEPVANSRERGVVGVVGCRAGRTRCHRQLDSQNLGAKALLVRLVGCEREPERHVAPGRNRGEKLADGVGGIERRVVGGVVLRRSGQFPQQRREAHFGVKFAERGHVWRLQAKRVERKRDGSVGVNQGELLAEPDELAAFLERLAVAGAFDFCGMGDGAFGAAELLDQLPRAHFADAGLAPLPGGGFVAGIARAGDVVDGIAHQGHDVRHLLGGNTHDLLDFLFVDEEIVFRRVQDLHAPADQLQQVLVAGDDQDIEILLGGLARQRANDVVGLVPRNFQDGQAHGLAVAADVGQLHAEVFRHGRALRLVGGEELVAKRGRGGVEHDSDVIRAQFLVLQQAPHHGGEQIGHLRGNARGGLQAVHGGVKRPEDVAHGVDQEEAFWVFGRHARARVCARWEASIADHGDEPGGCARPVHA